MHQTHTSAMYSSQDRLKSLAGCGDLPTLRSAFQELCSEFGTVTHIDVLTVAKPEKRSALFFLRMESNAQEQQLITTLGASRFGNDVLVIVDFPAVPDHLDI